MAIPSLLTDLSGVQIEDTRDAFAALKNVYDEIPPDTKNALKAKWKLKLQGAIAQEIKERTEYPDEERKADGQRLVRIEDAIDALGTLEADLVNALVITPADLLWRRYRGYIEGADLILSRGDIVWSLVKSAFFGLFTLSYEELKTLWEIAESIFAVAVAEIAETITIQGYAKHVVAMIHLRDKAIRHVRLKALPQRPARRYRRRKKSRT